MKNDTPLIEAMIMFMREFRVITTDSKSKIKSDDLEALGEPFAPEYFYETIRQLKRFSHMKVWPPILIGGALDANGLYREASSKTPKSSLDSFWTDCTRRLWKSRRE